VEYKNLYRRYKISQITIDGITSKEKEIIDFILSKIKDLTLFIDDNGCHNYMNSKGEWIFEYSEENYALYVRYYDFLSVLMDKYPLKYDDIQDIIKGMVETTYKIKVGKVISSRLMSNYVIEFVYYSKIM